MFYHAHGREELHFLFHFCAARNFNHDLHCQAEPVDKGLTGCDSAQFLLAISKFIKDFFLPIIQIFSKAFFVSAEQFQNFFPLSRALCTARTERCFRNTDLQALSFSFHLT